MANSRAFMALLFLALLACGGHSSDPMPPPPTRAFLMGSSQWPPSFDLPQVERMFAFKRTHMDLAVYHQVEGVPWVDLDAGNPIPPRILSNWRWIRAEASASQRFYLALTPLNFARNGLADLSNQAADHSPLPADWASLPLNDPKVKAAYLKYCQTAIQEFKPDFLAIAIECNMLASLNAAGWTQFLDLNHSIYAELKKTHPDLPIFDTVQYEHLQGYSDASVGKQAIQQQAVRDLMQSSDILAISIYPYGPWVLPQVPASYLDGIWSTAASTGKPTAIAETGFPSAPFTAYGYTFSGTPALQDSYVKLMLDQAQAHRCRFVVNWVSEDYEGMLPDLSPDMQEIAKVWVFDGLLTSSEAAKPALAAWDAALAKTYQP
jgi:hypothetical protein